MIVSGSVVRFLDDRGKPFVYHFDPLEFNDSKYAPAPRPATLGPAYNPFRVHKVDLMYSPDAFRADEGFSKINLLLTNWDRRILNAEKLEISTTSMGIDYRCRIRETDAGVEFRRLWDSGNVVGSSHIAVVDEAAWCLQTSPAVCMVLRARMKHLDICLRPGRSRGDHHIRVEEEAV